MSKWVILGLLTVIAVGLAIWTLSDPRAGATAAEMWGSVRAWFARARIDIGGGDLWAPVGKAFRDFGDSVAGLWSRTTIRIEVPAVQMPH